MAKAAKVTLVKKLIDEEKPIAARQHAAFLKSHQGEPGAKTAKAAQSRMPVEKDKEGKLLTIRLEYLAKAKEEIGLGKLCPAGKGAIVTLGFDYNAFGVNGYLKANAQTFNDRPKDFIFVLDGLPDVAAQAGFKGCETGLPDNVNLQIHPLADLPENKLFADLSYLQQQLDSSIKKINGLKTNTALSAKEQSTKIEAEKAEVAQLMGSIQSVLVVAIKSGVIEGDAIKDLSKAAIKSCKKEDAKGLSSTLDGLGYSLAVVSKKHIMQNATSEGISQFRAQQINDLAKNNPGKTIIVRAGLSLLYGGTQRATVNDMEDVHEECATLDEVPQFVKERYAVSEVKGMNDFLASPDGVISFGFVELAAASDQKPEDNICYDAVNFSNGDFGKVTSHQPHLRISNSLYREE